MKPRLNIGSGADIREGYVNVDAHGYPGVDIVANILTVKFPPESFREILAKDILEHLTFMEAKWLVRKCFEWLKPKGIFTVHVQNLPYLAGELAKGGDYNTGFHLEILRWMYGVSAAGESVSPYRFHHWGYSKESMSRVLRTVGFRVVKAEVDCEGFGILLIGYKDGERNKRK